MSVRFAEGTTVPIARSREEIESLVTKRGAQGFLSGYAQGEGGTVVARIQFALANRHVRFEIRLPPIGEFKKPRKGQYRPVTDELARKAMEAEHRRLWRALALGIKAKLELAQSGIETFEEVFLANIVTADGMTVKDYVLPAIAEMYESGRVPNQLLLGPGPSERS